MELAIPIQTTPRLRPPDKLLFVVCRTKLEKDGGSSVRVLGGILSVARF